MARTTSAEERKKQSHLRQQSKVDPPSPLFNKEEGRWKDNRVFELKFATVFAFLFLSIVFVLLFAGVKVPLIAVWISVLFFGLCGQVLLQYFVERYDHGADLKAIIAACYSLYAFAWGVSAARFDEARATPSYQLVLSDGSVLQASHVRRVGANSLIRVPLDKSWILLPHDEVVSIARVRDRSSFENLQSK